MTESGTPIPNMRQLYRYVQDLTYRLEKTEKELRKLKSVVNSRKRIELLVWLNQPSQTPSVKFEDWSRGIKATESDMMEVLNGNLTDGILSCLQSYIKHSSHLLPIRCFSQKPGTIYVYSAITNADSSVSTEWQQMRSEQLLKLATHISLSIRREFRIWNTALICSGGTNSEYDQTFMDRLPKYIIKLNSDVEKRLPDIKKGLFSKLAENIRLTMDGDIEND